MTFDEQKKKSGRLPIQVVEIYPDFCTNIYGLSPCNAGIGITGDSKCYNTFFTCQDKTNFERIDFRITTNNDNRLTTNADNRILSAGFNSITTAFGNKLIFTTETSSIPSGVTAFPVIQSISTSPTKIDLKGISKRAVIKITLKDFAFHDRGIDPYVDTRAFNPMESGTFFSRFLARNKYLQNRKLVLKTGYIDEENPDLLLSDDFEEREYIIDSISGGDGGTVTISAKDILKFTQEKNARIPQASIGQVAIANPVGTTDIEIQLDTAGGYKNTGYVRIDDEIIFYDGIVNNKLLQCQRGKFNTVIEEHSEETKVQECIFYDDTNVIDIVYDIFVNYTETPINFIDKSDWESGAGIWLTSYRLTRLLSTPESVFKILEEIINNAQIIIWWDELLKKIRLRPLANQIPGEVIRLYTDDDILQNSINITEKPLERVSQITYDYNLRNQVADITKSENYKNAEIFVDSDSESPFEWGLPSFKDIKGNWVTFAGIAREVSSRILTRLRDVPYEMTIELDIGNCDIRTGDFVYIETKSLVDIDGQAKRVPYLVMEMTENKLGHSYKFLLQNYVLPDGRVGLIAPNDLLDYTLESEINKNKYIFISGDDGKMSNGDEGFVFT